MRASPTQPNWIGTTEAARIAGVTDTAIRKAWKAGKLRARELYGRRLFQRASVERYAAQRAAKAA